MAAIYKYTWTTEILWRKRDGTATLSRGERPDPCLDKLLLVFQAPNIKEGPLLLYKGLFWVVIFADTGGGVAEYIKGGYLQCKRRSGPNG